MSNLGITDLNVMYQVARNQFGTGEELDSNAMNQTFARKDGKSLLSAIGEVGKFQDYSPEVKTVNFTADQLVDKYNNSRGAQDFKLTSSYDPKTNTFIEDVSAFGFEGDAATKTYTPEEFIAKLGYKGDDYNQFNFSQPQQQAPAPRA